MDGGALTTFVLVLPGNWNTIVPDRAEVIMIELANGNLSPNRPTVVDVAAMEPERAICPDMSIFPVTADAPERLPARANASCVSPATVAVAVTPPVKRASVVTVPEA